MARYTFDCWKCGHVLEFDTTPPRSEECPECEVDVRCCLNCQHYDASVSRQCREPTGEFVSKKDHANFCGMFEPRKDPAARDEVADDARSKLEALFK